MTQQRITSLRILQNNKKKSLAPIIYLLIGFISGILFTVLIFFSFFSNSSTATIEQLQANEENTEENNQENNEINIGEKNAIQQNDKKSAATIKTDEPIKTQHDAEELLDDNNFTQPGSNDLNKFFQRTAPPASPSVTKPNTSPFANEPHSKKIPTKAAEKRPQNKTEATDKVEKTAAPVTKKVLEKPAEPEIKTETEAETPQASIQITVIQKPSAVHAAN